MDALEKQLERDAAYYAKKCQHNYYFTYSLFILAILSSFSASILAASGMVHKLLLAMVTAIPGSAILAISVLKTDQKAQYFFRKKNLVRHILWEYKYESSTRESTSKKLREMEEKMESEWPGFGKLADIRLANGSIADRRAD
jgi:hypothetical protein